MHTVKVRLRKPTRVFTFACDGIELQRDEHCIVRSERGLEFGTCVLPPEECPDDMRNRYKMTVVRKATHNDEGTFRQIETDEVRAREICEHKIHDHGLPMKLVDAEYTFDKLKVVFYFTAAERVDFRKLVRDLAQELKVRIELRHIQVRDEAKIVGGVGVCGRELCCATWLGDFQPISMKMAKRQNLSLNPSKISGQCGRLLCCLSYENFLYPSRRKQAEQKKAAAEAQPPEPETAQTPPPPEPQAKPNPPPPERKPARKEEAPKSKTPPPAKAEQQAAPEKEGAAEQSQAERKSDKSKKRRRRRRRNPRKQSGGSS